MNDVIVRQIISDCIMNMHRNITIEPADSILDRYGDIKVSLPFSGCDRNAICFYVLIEKDKYTFTDLSETYSRLFYCRRYPVDTEKRRIVLTEFLERVAKKYLHTSEVGVSKETHEIYFEVKIKKKNEVTVEEIMNLDIDHLNAWLCDFIEMLIICHSYYYAVTEADNA